MMQRDPSPESGEADKGAWVLRILDFGKLVRQGAIYGAYSMPSDPVTVADETYHDREAPIYDGYSTDDRIRLAEAWLLPVLVNLVGDGVVVDVGCGTGRVTRELLSRGRMAVAIDHSNAMLMKLLEKEQSPHLVAIRADARELPILNQSCDGVICSGVLHHIPDWDRVIAEAARVLRPGGRLILREPNADYAWNLFKPTEATLARVARLINRTTSRGLSSSDACEPAPFERHLCAHDVRARLPSAMHIELLTSVKWFTTLGVPPGFPMRHIYYRAASWADRLLFRCGIPFRFGSLLIALATRT